MDTIIVALLALFSVEQLGAMQAFFSRHGNDAVEIVRRQKMSSGGVPSLFAALREDVFDDVKDASAFVAGFAFLAMAHLRTLTTKAKFLETLGLLLGMDTKSELVQKLVQEVDVPDSDVEAYKSLRFGEKAIIAIRKILGMGLPTNFQITIDNDWMYELMQFGQVIRKLAQRAKLAGLASGFNVSGVLSAGDPVEQMKSTEQLEVVGDIVSGSHPLARLPSHERGGIGNALIQGVLGFARNPTISGALSGALSGLLGRPVTIPGRRTVTAAAPPARGQTAPEASYFNPPRRKGVKRRGDPTGSPGDFDPDTLLIEREAEAAGEAAIEAAEAAAQLAEGDISPEVAMTEAGDVTIDEEGEASLSSVDLFKGR